MNSSTKFFIKFLLTGVVLGMLALSISVNFGFSVEMNRLRQKLAQKESYIKKQDVDLKTVSTLSNKTWYIVNDSTVSSQEDGQGQVIDLHDKIKSQSSRMYRKQPQKNGTIMFYGIMRDVPYYNICGALGYIY